MSIIGPRARTWNNYSDRVFYGIYDGMPRVELDSSKFKFRPVNQRGLHHSEDDFRKIIEPEIISGIKAIYDKGIAPNEIEKIKKEVDRRHPAVYTLVSEIIHYLENNPSFNVEDIKRFVKQEKPYLFNFSPKQAWFLQEVLNAPELFAAYPQLKKLLVIDGAEKSWNSYGGVIGNNIYINLYYAKTESKQKRHSSTKSSTLFNLLRGLLAVVAKETPCETCRPLSKSHILTPEVLNSPSYQPTLRPSILQRLRNWIGY